MALLEQVTILPEVLVVAMGLLGLMEPLAIVAAVALVVRLVTTLMEAHLLLGW